ncbi:hypothetical protein HPP92_014955 [Vanilla planifolia]|uniref:Uncharacterized protein n=1 Tax=Vanilla planifolia TaxID=51239 RepID=A0A835QKA2_VANPL|nr:hypothetical protein HPP92_014955 [Vanilla planifolia]
MEEEPRKGTKRLALSYLCRFPELCHVILAASRSHGDGQKKQSRLVWEELCNKRENRGPEN